MKSINSQALIAPIKHYLDAAGVFAACVKDCFIEKNKDGYCYDRLGFELPSSLSNSPPLLSHLVECGGWLSLNWFFSSLVVNLLSPMRRRKLHWRRVRDECNGRGKREKFASAPSMLDWRQFHFFITESQFIIKVNLKYSLMTHEISVIWSSIAPCSNWWLVDRGLIMPMENKWIRVHPSRPISSPIPSALLRIRSHPFLHFDSIDRSNSRSISLLVCVCLSLLSPFNPNEVHALIHNSFLSTVTDEIMTGSSVR